MGPEEQSHEEEELKRIIALQNEFVALDDAGAENSDDPLLIGRMVEIAETMENYINDPKNQLIDDASHYNTFMTAGMIDDWLLNHRRDADPTTVERVRKITRLDPDDDLDVGF